ncbi:hypothetical protein WJX82_004647 [Trebouxia sp. C0006]
MSGKRKAETDAGTKTAQRPRRKNEHQLPCVTCHKTEDAWWRNCKLFSYTSRTCCNACRLWAKDHPETPKLPVRHSMLTPQMRQLETELINKDFGAKMQLQEQKEQRKGGDDLPGTDPAVHLPEDNQLPRLSLEASQALSAQGSVLFNQTAASSLDTRDRST